MFHRSERLLLRPLWPEDWRAVFDGVTEEAIVRNLASAPWPYAEQDARDFVALPEHPRHPRFLITRADDAAVIGTIGIDHVKSDVELGYWIAREHWAQGYATEAGRSAIAVARMLGHKVLTAGHFVDNPASGRVLRKLGFQPTGAVRNRDSKGRAQPAPVVEYRLHLAASGTSQRAA